jgi:hypothetical protein
LLGLEITDPEESERRLMSQTQETLREDLKSVMSTMLAIGPRDLEELPGWTRHAYWSSEAVDGKHHRPINQREEGELVVGDEGVSWVYDDACRRTVRWNDAVAGFCWDNGVRAVMGPTGVTVSLVPWNWQGGSAFTSLVDAHIEPTRRIRLGAGDTQYLRDEKDPHSRTDLRWLASITGAACDQQRVDLVIDTDGFFILFDRTFRSEGRQRFDDLRSMDRQALLSGSRLNRWMPSAQIANVKLSKTRLSRVQAMKATLTVTTVSGEIVKVHLVSDEQVKLAKDALTNLLGDRFLR